MLETIVSEKSVTPKPSPPQQAQQPPVATPTPVTAPAPGGGRFKGMLARASTLNGRRTSLPAANLEKALPPPSAPGLPDVAPMGDNAPTPVPTAGKTAPAPTIALAEKLLVAEPEGAEADDLPPPLTPPKAEGPGPSVKDKDKVPQLNGAENEKAANVNGASATATATATLNGKVETDAGADAPLPVPQVLVEETQPGSEQPSAESAS